MWRRVSAYLCGAIGGVSSLALAAALAYGAVPSFSLRGWAPAATPAVASSLQIKATPGNLLSLNVTSGGTAGAVLILDSATVPSSGSSVTPIKCYELAASSTLDLHWGATPLGTVNGIVVLFSTGGCFTFTASVTAFISGEFE
jgi:hypothetical protein